MDGIAVGLSEILCLISATTLPTASSYHEVFAVAQLDKADAACAEADAARPDR
jgi:hypothetical protein